MEQIRLYVRIRVLKCLRLWMQDATKFALVNEGRKRYSQSINIKTVGGWRLALRSLLFECGLHRRHKIA